MANVFGLKFGGQYTDLRTGNIDDDILNLSGVRLAKYIWNNYKTSLFKGKYYGRLVSTFKDGKNIEVSKEHPAGLRHVKRYSKCTLENDCVLTGMCYDNEILQPVYDFLNRPDANTTFADLINEIEGAIQTCFNNVEDWLNSDELENQDWEYTEDGKRW